MRAVVTGGTGFLGSHLVEHLLANNIEVISLSRGSTSSGYLGTTKAVIKKADINNQSEIEDCIEAGDMVFHTAALLGSAAASREAYYRVNVEGTMNVLRAAINKKASTFTYVSTFAGMGPVGSIENPMTEETVCRPDNIYGETKVVAEEKIKELAQERIPVVIVRPNIIYGPRMNTRTAAGKLFFNMRKSVFVMVGNTKNYFPVTYVKNLAASMLFFAQNHKSGINIYLMVDGEPVQLNYILKRIRDQFGVNKIILSIPYGLAWAIALLMEGLGKVFHFTPLLARYVVRAMGKSYFFYSMKKSEKAGFTLPFTLEEGIQETADWMKGI
ncbi:MAG: NAD(P)-dependent oxidoreductase [Spirochaetales bacterium]|nr:NAD(P)-dependent oxidoreductase [Spirochaetales bacterium]